MAVWQLAGSVAAVGLLVLLAWKLGFAGRPDLLNEAEARSLASELPGGFDAAILRLDRLRNAALLRDVAGRIVLVAPAGAHFVARSLEPGVAVSSAEGVLTLRHGRLSVTLDLGSEADDWAAAISRLG